MGVDSAVSVPPLQLAVVVLAPPVAASVAASVDWVRRAVAASAASAQRAAAASAASAASVRRAVAASARRAAAGSVEVVSVVTAAAAAAAADRSGNLALRGTPFGSSSSVWGCNNDQDRPASALSLVQAVVLAQEKLLQETLRIRPLAGTCRQENAFFECRFPYVCPEPVLAKRSFTYINGSKTRLFAIC